jgi:hypothetical protein
LCDPTNSTDAPPECEYCNIDGQVGSNGCQNQGFCKVTSVTTVGAPPNYEIALCQCQTGFVPPQCQVPFLTYFGRSDLIVYRWCFMAGEVAVAILAVLVMMQHLHYAFAHQCADHNKTKAFGALVVFMSALMGALYFGVNPGGLGFGYPSSFYVVQHSLLVYFLVEFIMVAIAINTSNWIWVGLAAASVMRRKHTSWPLLATMVTCITAVVLTTLNIFFACYQVVEDNYKVFFFVAAGFGITLCLFSCVSGAIVMVTIKSVDADRALLYRSASQLVLLCSGELVASVLLVVVIALPSSAYTSGLTLFGISFIFTSLVLYTLQILLLLQFRIAFWQRKEVNLSRPSVVVGDAARRRTSSFSDSLSRGVSTYSVELTSSSTDKKGKNSLATDQGVIIL